MRDTLNDMQLYLVDEFVEEYQEGHLGRREALRRIAAITGSFAIATSILAACGAPTSTGTNASTSTDPASPSAAGAASSAAASASASSAASPAASAAQTTVASPDPAVSVGENDPAIEAQMVEFEGDGATLVGYLAKPTDDGPFPLILVCHANRGLTEHIKDVTRRVAKANYVEQPA